MNRKTSQVAKIVKGYLGRNELIDWWRVAINLKLRREGGWKLSTKQLVQIFRALNKPFKVEKTGMAVGSKKFMFYSVKGR